MQVNAPETNLTAALATLALDTLEGGADGFFLMVESASIDKQSHGRNACGSIGEMEQLEEALEQYMKIYEIDISYRDVNQKIDTLKGRLAS